MCLIKRPTTKMIKIFFILIIINMEDLYLNDIESDKIK